MQNITDTTWVDYNYIRVDRKEVYLFSFMGGKRDRWLPRDVVLKIDKQRERFQVYTWRAKELKLI